MRAQGNLDLGAGAFVSQLHGNTRRNLISMVAEGQHRYTQYHRIDGAVRHANDWSDGGLNDCYFSINGYDRPRRNQENVSQLNGFHVDFDYHKIPKYKHMECPEFMAMVLRETPGLPAPTVILDSGRGCWAFWLFDKPAMIETKHAKSQILPNWREHEVALIRAVVEQGGDPAAGDASRLTRMANTINSKNYAHTSAWTTGIRYKPQTIMAAIKALAPQPAIKPRTTSKTKPQTKPKTSNVTRFKFSPYSIAHARMSDLRSIGLMRGGYSDNRRAAYFYYAVCLSFYCGSPEQINAECDAFAREFFDDPENYTDGKVDIQDVTRRAKSLFDRKKASQASLLLNQSPRHGGKGKYYHQDNPHTITSNLIIEVMGITLDEMNGANGEDQLQILIAPKIKAEREMRRRRAAGVKPWDEHCAERAAEAQRKRDEAQEFRDQGMTVKAIAELMGCTTKTVQRRLSA